MKTLSNSYKVCFSYSSIKDFAKDRRNQRCIVNCRLLLEQSEASLLDAKNIESLVLWQLCISTHSTGQVRVLRYIMKVNEAPLLKKSKI